MTNIKEMADKIQPTTTRQVTEMIFEIHSEPENTLYNKMNNALVSYKDPAEHARIFVIEYCKKNKVACHEINITQVYRIDEPHKSYYNIIALIS